MGTTVDYVGKLRAAGVTADVSIGVVGPCKLETRARMALRCSVEPPPAEVPSGSDEERGGSSETWPATYVRGLASWLPASDTHSPVSRHAYPFGGLRSTLEWLDSLDELLARAAEDRR